MLFRAGDSEYKAWASENTVPYERESTLWENFTVGVGEMVDENLSISSAINAPDYSDRDRELNRDIDAGEFPSDFKEKFVREAPGVGIGINYGGMAEYANLKFGKSYKTNSELITDRDHELDIRRVYREDIMRRSPDYGTIAQLAGGFAGAALDPINIGAAFVPMGYGINGLSRAKYTASMVGKGATLGVASAVAVEPFIYSWKQEIGAEYLWEDAVFNMVASGILEGSIAGVSGSIFHRFNAKKPVRTPNDTDSTYTTKVSQAFQDSGVEKVDADNVARTILEAENAPDPTMDSKEFTESIEQTQDSFDVGVNNDVEPTRGIDDVSKMSEEDRALLVQEYIDDSGNVVSYKESIDSIDDDLQAFTNYKECIR